jgi:hypothetical protein
MNNQVVTLALRSLDGPRVDDPPAGPGVAVSLQLPTSHEQCLALTLHIARQALYRMFVKMKAAVKRGQKGLDKTLYK